MERIILDCLAGFGAVEMASFEQTAFTLLALEVVEGRR
jgi:hypothetical protein